MTHQKKIEKAPSVKELINLQDVDGQVKPYQVKQLMQLIERYNLELEA